MATQWKGEQTRGEPARTPGDGCGSSDDAFLMEVLSLLEEGRTPAPEGFSERVMAALPEAPDLPRFAWLRRHWPRRGRWVPPALIGAATAMAVILLVSEAGRLSQKGLAPVTFELHAPHAQRVEVVGSFNGWRPGETALEGPDATGHWTATVHLSTGCYDYLFLVDGKELVADPRTEAYRPDGFGGRNSLLVV